MAIRLISRKVLPSFRLRAKANEPPPLFSFGPPPYGKAAQVSGDPQRGDKPVESTTEDCVAPGRQWRKAVPIDSS
jgi:hypothetical protein